MSSRSAFWILPSLAFAVLINAVLFLLLPSLSRREPVLETATEPVPVHLVRVREKKPPPPEEEEIPEPERPRPEEVPEFVQPDLVRPEVRPLEMEEIPFRVEMNPRILGGPKLGLRRFYEVGDLDQPPRPLVKMPPVYPYKAKRLEIEGYVKVKFLVDDHGAVSRVEVLEAQPRGVFEKSVLKVLPTWRFSPGRLDGEPVASWVVTTIRFELR